MSFQIPIDNEDWEYLRELSNMEVQGKIPDTFNISEPPSSWIGWLEQLKLDCTARGYTLKATIQHLN